MAGRRLDTWRHYPHVGFPRVSFRHAGHLCLAAVLHSPEITLKQTPQAPGEAVGALLPRPDTSASWEFQTRSWEVSKISRTVERAGFSARIRLIRFNLFRSTSQATFTRAKVTCMETCECCNTAKAWKWESNKTPHEHACVALPWLCSNVALRLSPSISQSKAQDAAQNPAVRSGAIASTAAKPKSIVLLLPALRRCAACSCLLDPLRDQSRVGVPFAWLQRMHALRRAASGARHHLDGPAAA